MALVVDLSSAAAATDLRPVRAAVMSRCACALIRAFFDENPLSQLAVLALRDGIAHVVSPLSSSPDAHAAALRAALTTGGEASFENGLRAALDILRAVPPHGSREVLLLAATLSTCDPGDLQLAVREARDAKVRVSVVGLAAEVYACAEMARATGGTHGVALDEAHLFDLVLAHAAPPQQAGGGGGGMLMGFPARAALAPGSAAFVGEDARVAPGAYVCPRCGARGARLPSACHVCGLTLVSAPHLARSYHHLFPVPPFAEVDAQVGTCAGCDGELGEAPSRCPRCADGFCCECDLFVHEILHNCPGCELAGRAAAAKVPAAQPT